MMAAKKDETKAARLEHSEGGVTTRDDATDLGVPMVAGAADEPVGPEDALGDGPKRGDYRDRIGEAGRLAHIGAEPQAPKAEQIGDEEGKGGVSTESVRKADKDRLEAAAAAATAAAAAAAPPPPPPAETTGT